MNHSLNIVEPTWMPLLISQKVENISNNLQLMILLVLASRLTYPLRHGKVVTLGIHKLYIFVECTCDPKGAERGDQCAHNPTGECRCVKGVIGPTCNKCDDGYYGFGQFSTIGCKGKL